MPIYSETQRPRQSWLFLIIGFIAAVGWAIFVQQIVRGRPVGNNPMSDWGVWVLTALLGVGVPLFFLWFRLETTVYSDRVEIRMLPFSYRVIRAAEITHAAARTYRPLREFGGWGLRWGFSGFGANRAYTISGNEGVQLVLRDGKRVLIGSRHPRELAGAIQCIL